VLMTFTIILHRPNSYVYLLRPYRFKRPSLLR